MSFLFYFIQQGHIKLIDSKDLTFHCYGKISIAN